MACIQTSGCHCLEYHDEHYWHINFSHVYQQPTKNLFSSVIIYAVKIEQQKGVKREGDSHEFQKNTEPLQPAYIVNDSIMDYREQIA